ncbi:Alpha/beta hydrolase family protein [Planctomycetes bacterium Pla163]|uniref:Alpha/beta hydrolase family protein n=1 Tax=Rohdeia mirabilis TaxID=2528008 RepID=A0A518D3M7_9BACT|nr:Alpha/beta hydrolase family protein [Planctomycetes bacterium Pla163]
MESIERLDFVPDAPRHATPILLQHGLFLCAAAWERTARELCDVHGWRVYAASLPGHGGSSMHKNDLSFYNVEDYVNPLARQVLKLKEPVALIAHGAAALFARRLLEKREFASHEIGELAALGMVAPLPPTGLGAWLGAYRKRHRLHALTKRPAANPERFFDSESRARGEWLAPGDATPKGEWFDALQGESRQVIEQLDRGIKLLDKRFSPPARMFLAEHDAWFDRAAVEPLARDMEAEIEVVPGSGHGVMLGAGAVELARRIDAWLSSLED